MNVTIVKISTILDRQSWEFSKTYHFGIIADNSTIVAVEINTSEVSIALLTYTHS